MSPGGNAVPGFLETNPPNDLKNIYNKTTDSSWHFYFKQQYRENKKIEILGNFVHQ